MPIPSIAGVILAVSCSLDAFTAAFAYGSNKIKIPMLSTQIINLICSTVLGVSLWVGSFARSYMPEWLTIGISFAVLAMLGVIKLMDSVTKSIIRKYNNINKEIKFSMFNFKFILQLYADPEAADVDSSRTISPIEAIALAISLSLDGIAIGFGAALGEINIWAVFLTSLISDMIALMLGCYLGNAIARKSPFNLSWLSGIILIVLAVMKLF